MKRDRRDAEFSRAIRERDNYTCQRCGNSFLPNSRGLHSAHLVNGRGKLATRWEPDNAVSLCYGDHRWLDTHPSLKREFAIERLGLERVEELERLGNLTARDLARERS